MPSFSDFCWNNPSPSALHFELMQLLLAILELGHAAVQWIINLKYIPVAAKCTYTDFHRNPYEASLHH
jgi:hypothetical protein